MWEGGTHLAAFITHGGGKLPVKEFTGLTHHTDWIPTLVRTNRLQRAALTLTSRVSVHRLGIICLTTFSFTKVAAGNGTLVDDVQPAMDGMNLWPAFIDPSAVAGPRDSVILNVDITNNARVLCFFWGSCVDLNAPATH